MSVRIRCVSPLFCGMMGTENMLSPQPLRHAMPKPCSARRELCYIAVPGCHSALTRRSHNASTEEGRALEHATHA